MMKNRLILLCAPLSLALLLTSVPAADVQRYLVTKGQEFSQTNATTAVTLTNQLPFRFVTSVDASTADSVLQAKVKLPNLQIKVLTNTGEGDFDFEQGYVNKSLLDANFAAGSYVMFMVGTNNGTNITTLPLAADNYPNIPKINNWAALQEVEAAQPLNLSWNAFTNGTANDFILVDISDADGNTVAASPALLTPGALNGTALSAQISPGLLADNTAYVGSLMFVKRTLLNTTSYPGANGVAGYYRQTRFPLVTLPTPPPEGRIQFGATSYSVPENAGSVNVTITRSGADGDVSVDFFTQGGTAQAGADYTGVPTTTLTFLDGETSKTIPISVFDNFLVDGNRTVNLWLTNPTGGAVLGIHSSAVLTILDNEVAGAGKIQFATRSNSVPEAAGVVTLTLTRSGGSVGTVSASYETTNLTAIAGQNYRATNGTVTFAPGIITKTITVPIINDTLYQSNQVFQVNLTSIGGGAGFGTNTSTLVNIRNDDFGGTFAFKQPAYVTNENAVNFLVTVVRTGGAASGVTVDFATEDGTTVDGDRYSATNGTLTFAANQLSQNFLVPVVNSGFMYSNQFFFVTLSNATGGATVTNNAALNRAKLTVVAEDSSYSLASASYAATKGTPNVTVTVLRSGSLSGASSIGWFTSDVTAQSGVDYRGATNTLTFAANVASNRFVITLLTNTLVTGDRQFNISLYRPPGSSRIGLTNAMAVIRENRAAGVVSFSTNTFNVSDAGTNAIITILRANVLPNTVLGSGVTVNFLTQDGTAVAGSDYTSASQTLTFAAGETIKKIAVPITKKTAVDINRNLGLQLQSTGGAALGSSSATLNILENKTALGIEFAGYSASKTSTNILVRILRTGVATGTASAAFTTLNGTALTPTDYKVTSGTASFPPNTNSRIVSIPIVTNSASPGGRSFNFRLATPVGCLLGPVTNSSITILDSGSGPSIISFSAPTFVANKTNASAIVTVTRSGGLSSAASVDIATLNVTADDVIASGANGTATTVANDPYAGSFYDSDGFGDYLSINNTVTFEAGVSSKNVSIPLLNNPLGGIRSVDRGSNRWFMCKLSNPTGTAAQLGNITNAHVEITDTLKHGTIQFNPVTYNASAASGSVNITVTRTGGSEGIVLAYFNPTRTGDTAVANTDFDGIALGTFFNFIVFNPGETSKVITLSLFSAAGSYPKTAHMSLNTPQLLFGATYGVTNATLTITP
jgi:hypothetical protein